MKEQLVRKVIILEWEFLDKVQNVGGRASCQNDWDGFEKYRKSQFDLYNEEMLESYISDLTQYKNLNYNPIMLKYAYMMKSNDREEFDKIKNNLPIVDEKRSQIIEQIVKIQLDMRLEFAKEYPNLSASSRAIYTDDDNKNSTSFETYLRAELSTYSPRTLFLYAKWTLNFVQKGDNIVRLIQENTVKNFGFSSLEEAENA